MTFTCARIFKRITKNYLKLSMNGMNWFVWSKTTSHKNFYPEKHFYLIGKLFASPSHSILNPFDQPYYITQSHRRDVVHVCSYVFFFLLDYYYCFTEKRKLSPKQLTEKCFCQQIKTTEKRCKQYVTNMFHSYFSIILCWYMETGLLVMVVIWLSFGCLLVCSDKTTENVRIRRTNSHICNISNLINSNVW